MASEKPDSFQCGPFEVARNPDVRAFVEKLNRLREAVDQNRLQPGVGYTLNRSSGGTSLTIKAGGGASPAPDLYPWRVIARRQGREIQAQVEKDGSQLFALGLGDPSAIAGLGEWKTLEPEGGFIWVKATYDQDLQVSSAEIAAGGRVPPDTENATHVGLAFVNARAEVVQSVRWFLQSFAACRDGKPALVIL